MILPELVLRSNVSKRLLYSGIDSVDLCQDRDYFLSYPHDIEYIYNSRGFRDQEWPDSELALQDAVWCIGDSFTVGVGAPFMHTWPQRVSTVSGRRTINVSMDGASNEWIARTAELIAEKVSPENIIVMWSYTHRRENPNNTLSDENRRLHYIKSTVVEDWEKFLDCSKRLSLLRSNIVEFAIPQFHQSIIPDINKFWKILRGASWPVDCPKTAQEISNLPTSVLLELETAHKQLNNLRDHLTLIESLTRHNIILIEPFDLGRDGHHFDLVTADWVAAQAVSRLK